MKSSTKQWLKNAFTMAVCGLAIRVVTMGFQTYLSRTVGPEGMGLANLTMTLYNFAVTLAVSGVTLGVTRLVSEAKGRKDPGAARAGLRYATRYGLVFSTLSASLLFGLSHPLGSLLLGDERTVIPLRILALSLIPMAMSSVYSGYFTAVGRVRGNSLIQIGEMGVKIASTVFLLSQLLPGGLAYACIAIVGGVTLSQSLSALASYILYRGDTKRYLIKASPKKENTLQDLLHISLPIAFSSYVRSGLLTVEHILIPLSLAKTGATHKEALASYGILSGMALPLVMFPFGILASFSPLLVPLFAERKARKEEREIRHLATRGLTVTSAVSIGCMGAIYTMAEEIGLVFFRNPEAGAYIRPLSLVLPLMFLDHVTDGILRGIGEEVYTMWVNIFDSLLSIVLVLLLLPHFGAMGYVYVIVLAEVFNFACSIFRLQKKTGVGYRPLSALILPLAFAALAGTVTNRLIWVDPYVSTPLWLTLRLVFYMTLYFLGHQLIRVFKERKHTSPLDFPF